MTPMVDSLGYAPVVAAVLLFIVVFSFVFILLFSFKPSWVCHKHHDVTVTAPVTGHVADTTKCVIGAAVVALLVLVALWASRACR